MNCAGVNGPGLNGAGWDWTTLTLTDAAGLRDGRRIEVQVVPTAIAPENLAQDLALGEPIGVDGLRGIGLCHRLGDHAFDGSPVRVEGTTGDLRSLSETREGQRVTAALDEHLPGDRQDVDAGAFDPGIRHLATLSMRTHANNLSTRLYVKVPRPGNSSCRERSLRRDEEEGEQPGVTRVNYH